MNAEHLALDSKSAKGLEDLRRQFALILEESDRRGARRLLQGALSAGHSQWELLRKVVSPAIEALAETWVHHELSLSQVYVAGLIAQDSVELLSAPVSLGRTLGQPPLPPSEEPVGKVVIGTAQGDHHGLGKLIVASFLRSAGFAVVDLGLTVSPKAFVEAALAEEADIIAVSALMIDPALKIREVREEMNRRGVVRTRLLVGGAPFRYNPDLYKLAGADATASTAAEAISATKRLLEERDGPSRKG